MFICSLQNTKAQFFAVFFFSYIDVRLIDIKVYIARKTLHDTEEKKEEILNLKKY